jgi:hypothetical protein
MLFLIAIADFGHGDLLSISLRTLPVFWLSVLVIFLRRKNALTPGDRLYIRWGFPLLILFSLAASSLIWTAKGYHGRIL